MVELKILKQSILDLDVDCVVNAANSGLARGGGICGAIFAQADADALTRECRAIGHCDTGSAVITPSCGLRSKYIIHAVGPVWQGGAKQEPQQLYGCYTRALELARENDIHSIAFPLISSGIFGYPKDKAWRKAIQACLDFARKCNNGENFANPESANPDDAYDLQIIIGVLNDAEFQQGQKILSSFF